MDEKIFNILENNETILYESIANVRKTNNQTFRFIIAVGTLIIFWGLFIIGVKNDYINFLNIIIFIITLIIISLGLLYGILYNLIIRYTHKNNKYFVTNERIISYNPKKGFKAKIISDIEHLGITREKDNYGDLTFSFMKTVFLNH